MPVPSVLTDLSVNEASNFPLDSDTVTPTTRPSDYMRAQAALLRRLRAQGAAVASAATVDLGAIADGEYVHITGVVTITSFGTTAAGIERTLVFDGALVLTHNATSLILPGGLNITTTAGDVAVFVSEGSGNWRCKEYLSNLSRRGVANGVCDLDASALVPDARIPASIARLASPTFTGAVVVPNAVASNQAVNRGQVLNISPATQLVTIANIASTTTNNSVSITAPCAGFIFAVSSLNMSSAASNGVNFAILINGTSLASDNTLLSQTQTAFVAVAASSVNTINAQTITGTTAPGNGMSSHVMAVFIPSP